MECYFCKNINNNTWLEFIDAKYNSKMDKFTLIEGYTWKSIFAFKPNGEALYLSDQNIRYKGEWFLCGNDKIAIFENKEEFKQLLIECGIELYEVPL